MQKCALGLEIYFVVAGGVECRKAGTNGMASKQSILSGQLSISRGLQFAPDFLGSLCKPCVDGPLPTSGASDASLPVGGAVHVGWSSRVRFVRTSLADIQSQSPLHQVQERLIAISTCELAKLGVDGRWMRTQTSVRSSAKCQWEPIQGSHKCDA